jgi:hypothetical protein
MVKQNAGLDREILSAGLSMAQNKLAHKSGRGWYVTSACVKHAPI